jgi:hypothetical protein
MSFSPTHRIELDFARSIERLLRNYFRHPEQNMRRRTVDHHSIERLVEPPCPNANHYRFIGIQFSAPANTNTFILIACLRATTQILRFSANSRSISSLTAATFTAMPKARPSSTRTAYIPTATSCGARQLRQPVP